MTVKDWSHKKSISQPTAPSTWLPPLEFKILTEHQYRELQALGTFDTKTSSWLKTPPEVRELGGALFGDFRYGRVFIYHNGAQSYYGVRGFRGSVSV
jgi:hypothetical protein